MRAGLVLLEGWRQDLHRQQPRSPLAVLDNSFAGEAKTLDLQG